MTSAVVAAGDNLSFAQSESKAVGITGGAMDYLRDNAPRIVGAMKVAANISQAFSGNPFLILDAVLGSVGRTITMIYGTKKNQQKLAEELKAGTLRPEADDTFMHSFGKLLKPREYPVESGAGFSMIAQMGKVGYGISRFFSGTTGFSSLVIGLVNLYQYGIIWFGKEAKKKDKPEDNKNDSLVFAKSESQSVGMLGWMGKAMKDNPVLVSSLLGIGVSVVGLVGGIIEGFPLPVIVGSAIYIAANALQALLVRKNDYNIEGAQAEQPQQKPLTFEEKLAARRQDDKNAGVHPA